METIRRIVLTIVIALAIAGCSGGTNLPTHRDWGGASPGALQAGQLVLSGDCVSLVDPISSECQTDTYWLVGDVTVDGSPATSP